MTASTAAAGDDVTLLMTSSGDEGKQVSLWRRYVPLYAVQLNIAARTLLLAHAMYTLQQVSDARSISIGGRQTNEQTNRKTSSSHKASSFSAGA